MYYRYASIILGIIILYGHNLRAQTRSACNPVIYADVPDMSMLRVGNAYYMSSTTMHMNPGVPVMKSEDLSNWEIVNYAYEILDPDNKALNLADGKSTYGKGSWASCLRYHNETYYVSTFAKTTNKTYIYRTKDIENGPWKVSAFGPAYHDHTLFFDDDGKIYMIWGGGELRMAELKEDLSGIKGGTERVLIENASAPAGEDIGLPAEGSQLFKVNGKYYLFNITWPRNGMRTVLVHRADKITGPYEGKVVLQDKGVAQGGLIDTPEGKWYAYLFRDYGAVGRIPYLVPVTWGNGWPILGVEGKVPDTLDLPAGNGLIPGIVASDDFSREEGEVKLPLVWQWNHNPDPSHWSLDERKGFLRITTGRVDRSVLSARNSLTQRTIGPECSGTIGLDVSGMKEGDFAGLALLQEKYAMVGVKYANGHKTITMVNAESGEPVEVKSIPLGQEVIHLKAECDFRDRKDVARFFYSQDGKQWYPIGNELHMKYTLSHFMGYRFALFNYATRNPGGYADFDYFDITDNIHR
ncbi:glycoside hydrolase [Sinomicrobium pectinilyticum]|uniref:Glycoside hydrolase n=1 Tax=Sinomicrobium pectinilyticum TaxID=1084421 RepID=A0A3N0EJE4_SINP1|nr:glycoside hydrolase 43 family protein [Sinomicrobium pectinilyticum]RNL87837.1 glycoside hydrolase [Sinomicrobium pectinilyticum]